MSKNELFDYIIIGAGSAGCVLANRLSRDPGNRVLLLEAGGRDTNPWIHIPVGYFKTLHNPATDWCYKTQPDPGLDGRAIDWPRGKTLGGSSSINGLLYIRGQADDYNYWRQLGNVGWSYEDVLPYFKKSENQENGADSYHGDQGELSVTNMRARREISEAFITAAEEMGIPRSSDFNGARQEGAGYFQLTAKNGLRCSAAKAFLNPVKFRKNLNIQTSAQVLKLLFQEDQPTAASAICYRQGRADHIARLTEGGEIILSAGAIGSPHLLQLSGICDGDLAQKIGVFPRFHAPDVGQNLKDHLQIRMVYKVKTKTLNEEINNLFRRMLIGLHYMANRGGAMSLGASHVCIFARSRPELERPDIQYHFQPLSADKPGIVMHDFPGVTTSVCQLRPESKGYIKTINADPETYPEIHANYLSVSSDQQCVIDAVKFTRKLMGCEAIRHLVDEEYLPGMSCQNDADILSGASKIAQSIYHPTSTCRMGVDDRAVVDPALKVKGIHNLRIADASIMPDIVSGNTNAPAIMIGEKASDLILASRRQA